VAERRSHLILMGLIFVALLGVVFLGVPGSPLHQKPTLGLDLQGGTEVVLKAVPPKGQKVSSDGMDTARSVMDRRVNKLGVTEPEIRKQGSDQMVIELAGVDPKRATELIGKTAKLELYDLQGDLVPPSADLQGNPTPQTSIFDLLVTLQRQAKKGSSDQFYLLKPVKKAGAKKPEYKLAVGPMSTRAAVLKSKYVRTHGKKGQLPKGHRLFAVPENMVVVTCGKGDRFCPNLPDKPERTYFYLFKYQPQNKEQPIPEMTGTDLNLKGTRQDFGQGADTGPIVRMDFTKSGGKKFQEITQTLAERGRIRYNQAGGQGDPRNYDQQFAIVLDREVKSAPSIDFSQYPSGLGATGAEITGIGSVGEAKDLALVLQTGALPYDFRQLEKTEISSTLGKDSLQEAKRAAIGGLIVVALFLLLFYRFLGLVAVIGLGIYAAFLYAAVLLFNVTLTLPGFAGLILTIGVAADANVVVFERIKEEVRAGKSVRAAIATGYAKGFHTIIDANVVTAITALILFLVATAGVKGFALMLLIGTVISLVTAVAATRAMLGLLAGFRWFENPAFMGASGTQKGRWLQIDFMRRRYIWFALAATVIAVSLGSLGVRGLNLGIDFKGGVQITFKTPSPTSLQSVRAQAADIGQKDAVVQGRGSLTGADKYTSFQIRLKKLPPAKQTTITNDLQDRLHVTSLGIKNVSSSFGHQIAVGALWAIFGSLLLIVLYIAFRFDFKFAGPVIVALIHDILITVGVYSITGREVTTSTVAAVLTVLGYSIYDTIIIFDRIRENVPIMRRASFATIANVSLWETIRRSLATTFITLLPVIALFIFGGATLQDFAFALIVGITSGAYSSIFIAAPLLTVWKEREPEYARRKGDVLEGAHGDRVLRQAEKLLADQPAPEPVMEQIEQVIERAIDAVEGGGDGARDAKREKRRQRRNARPHGRR
jgi:SecD/SecF fusion protein